MFKPVHSVSSWASRRVEMPRSWRTVPSIEFRNPCIHASDNVTFSVIWKDPTIVKVFWMIAGASTLNRVFVAGIGFVLVGDRGGLMINNDPTTG
jgi:hypothetical protein